jgi:hypothetical protein
MATCSGSLILHFDGTVMAHTEDEDGNGCAGREYVMKVRRSVASIARRRLRLLRRPVGRSQ